MLLRVRTPDRQVTSTQARQGLFSGQPLKLLLAICLGGFLAGGCRTAGNSTASEFASVVIRGNTPGQIENMAREVFADHGYRNVASRPDVLVFERKGSRLDNVAYGGWMSQSVWVRVKAAVVPIGEAVWRLECTAYRVEDIGTTTEEEIKLGRSRPYQKLLDQVASHLQGSFAPLP